MQRKDKPCTHDKNANLTSHYGKKNMENLQKIKIETIRSSSTTSGYIYISQR